MNKILMKRRKRKKVRLVFHDIQHFVPDSSDVYVWVFDPTPLLKKVIGMLMLFGTIAGCLFPLWPDWLRLGVYYLSLTGIGLFGVLLGLALVRTIIFGIIWGCTLGRHKLWILPNLTEDCGFLDSFKPFYTYEYTPGGAFSSPSQAITEKPATEKEGKEERLDDGDKRDKDDALVGRPSDSESGTEKEDEASIVSENSEDDANGVRRRKKSSVGNGSDDTGGFEIIENSKSE